MRTGASWEIIHFKYMRFERVYLLFDRKSTICKALLVDGGGEVVVGGGEVVVGGGEVVIGQVVLTVWRKKSKKC